MEALVLIVLTVVLPLALLWGLVAFVSAAWHSVVSPPTPLPAPKRVSKPWWQRTVW